MSENMKQNYLNHPKGIMSWLLTLDHKRIGLMYLVSGILFFFLGGLLALVMRFELAAPGNDIISNEIYNNAYTLAWSNNDISFYYSCHTRCSWKYFTSSYGWC